MLPGKIDAAADDLDTGLPTPPVSEAARLAVLGADLLRRAEESQTAMESSWEELLHQWEIRGSPIEIERLREMIARDLGSTPTANDFSREIIQLREDRRP